MILVRHELKQNLKSLLIWAVTVGLICYGCIVLYQSVEGQLADKAKLFDNMGAMTQALGLDKISIATLDGYFATQIAMMFALGAGMFSAMLGASLLSKEEEGHTSEFLYTLPLSRTRIVLEKYASLLVMIVLFNLICIAFEMLGFWQVGLDFSMDLLLKYHALALLMQLEIASLSFLMSSLNRRKPIGPGLGLVLGLFVADMMCRVLPDLDTLKYLTPYYYANGADVFSGEKLEIIYLLISVVVIVVSLISSSAICQRKDLAG